MPQYALLVQICRPLIYLAACTYLTKIKPKQTDYEENSWESSKRNICNCSIVIQVHSLETFLSSDRNFNMIIQTENKSLKKKKKADLESFTGETQESALIYSDFKHF